MKIDSEQMMSTSQAIASYLQGCHSNSASIQSRHNQIQNRLSALSNYLCESAYQAQRNESLLSNFKKGKVTVSHSENWNLMSQLSKKTATTYLSGSVTYTLATAARSFSSKFFSIRGALNVGDITAKVSCEATLWKNKIFDPKFIFNAEIDAALLSANLNTRLGTSKVYGNVNAKGYAGVAYAKAKAVLSKDEQTLDAGVGVAALKGSASASFHFFGASVTLTGYGSIGSAEASVTYSHKNREWEFGSKLGFICGLGYKIRVSY